MNIENTVNEVLTKVGRNMMLFQQLEHLLKFIIINGSISGYASELHSNVEQRASIVQKQSMGQLVGQYIETTNPDSHEASNEPEELQEAFFSFKFNIGCDSVYYDSKKEALAKLVSERNDLVHHLLPKFNSNSIESCIKIGNQLDDQADYVRHEIADLKAIVYTLQEGRKKLAEFINSDEGKKEFELSWLRQSRLVLLLGDIAIQTSRNDGWALLSIAGQLVNQHAPEEIAVLKERYGHKSLKALILATEIFDLYEEPTKKGLRLLYKLKHGWKLSSA